MERFDLRLDPTKVTALRRLAGRLSYETGQSVRWTDLLRRGIDWVLGAEGDPARVPVTNIEKKETK